MIKVSVIIPVFNAAKHLHKCMESLLSQTLTDCEFIFINDGSKDESQNIIETYQKNDKRVILVNQENKGVSVARNEGLKVATGEYIGFVDADDFSEKDCFETLYFTAEKHDLDVVISDYYCYLNESSYVIKAPFQHNQVLEKASIQKQLIPHFISHDNLNAIWNKLYKKSVIDTFQIQFPIGVALGEDGWFNLNYFFHSNKVLFLEYVGYHYVEVSGSATRNFKSKNYFARIEEEFLQDYSAFTNDSLTVEQIDSLKSTKFLNRTISLVNEYCDPKNELKSDKKKYINEVFKSKTLTNILDKYYNIVFLQKSKFERLILFALKYKLRYLLYALTAYSRFRNK